MFGFFYGLFMGASKLIGNISDDIRDQEARERAKNRGDITYVASDGTRLVSDNRKVVVTSEGITDLETWETVVDYKQNRIDTTNNKVKSYNEKSKKEAIIKGEKYYKVIWADEDGKMPLSFEGSFYRLLENDLPVKNTTDFLEKGVRTNDPNKSPLANFHYEIVGCKEMNFGFYYIKEGEWSDKDSWFGKTDYNFYKNYNTKTFIRIACIYPIDEVKWIYEYCKRYNIPLPTWDELDKACLEEHPLGWKQPEADYRDFNRFLKNIK